MLSEQITTVVALLRTAMARLDSLDNTPVVKRAADRATIWNPYRSYAAAYLWRRSP
jgi:3-methyladenine DNA glycosylase/8-oxoguanine DNA glycosylase